jgi:MSHA biogenesis protein MshK
VRSVTLALVFACAFAQAPARAQTMSDPMRPPGAAPSGAQSSGSSSTASGLQAVITSPQRKLAVIDGSVVPLGSRARDGTLTGLSDSVAVLKKNGARDVLLMHPNIDKKRRSP